MNEEKKEKLMPTFDNVELSIKTWWLNLRKIIDIYLWAVFYAVIPIFIVVLFYFLIKYFFDIRYESPEIFYLASFIVLAIFLISTYFFIKAYIAFVLLIKNDFKGDSKELLKSSQEYVWPYIALSLLTIVLLLLWALLLIIPAIIFSVFYSMAYMVLFFENKKGMAAIRRSKELVKGYFWPVFGRIFLMSILMTMFLAIISWPMNYFSEDSLGFGLINLLVQIISFLIGPISLFFTYNIYKNLKNIKDVKA